MSAPEGHEAAQAEHELSRGPRCESGEPAPDEVAAMLASKEAGGAATRGGAIRVAGYIVNVALGTLAAAFLFRHLGAKNVGVYVTAMTIAGIVSGLTDLGLTTLGLRELSERDLAGRERLMRSLLGMRIAVTLTGTAGAVVFSVLVGYQPVLVAGVALAGAGLLLNTTQGTLGLPLVSRLRLGLLTSTETARQVVTTMLTIALVALGAGVLVFIGLSIPVGALFVVITAWLVRREVPLLPRFDRAEWRTLAREILPFALTGTITVIYFRLSVIVVSLAVSAAELGYFGLSFRVLEILILIPGVMLMGVFPIFVRSALDDRDRLAYAVSRVFAVSLIVGGWFALAIVIGAPFATKLVGGAAFSKSTPVLRIQGVGLGASFVSSVWGLTLVSIRRYRALVYISLSSLIVGTVLVTILASTHGAQGAALGTAITEVASAVLVPVVLLKLDRQVVPSMSGVPMVGLAAGAAALVMLIPGVSAVALVSLATVIYLVMLLKLRAVPEELLVEVRSLWARYRSRGRLTAS